jgi:predicted ATP-dependent endonuclease of OLD family
MVKIQTIHIKRYRSIIDLNLKVNTNNNFITICGENNTGKTNTLRAIALFFNPSKYEPSKDAPSHKYEGSGGGAVFPNISIEFVLENDDNNDLYQITRKFDKDGLEETIGKKYKLNSRRSTHLSLDIREIEIFFKNIHFFFVESINISFPQLINELIDDLYDIEYGEARFRGLKSALKQSFDDYARGLLGILNTLSEEINPKFKEYKENWGVEFSLETDVKKFRDLITDDITFYIKDSSNKNIEGKGAGLQRLGYILLHNTIIEKIKPNKSVILLIDEPDVYLHQGLQKKLKNQLYQLAQKSQYSSLLILRYLLTHIL